MSIENIEFGRLMKTLEILSGGEWTHETSRQDFGFKEGDAVFIRTATMYYTGRVESVTNAVVVLSAAAWIAATGPFADAMAAGALSDAELYPADWQVHVALSWIVDWVRWPHALPQ